MITVIPCIFIPSQLGLFEAALLGLEAGIV
jgi:hypothetical protein